VTSAKDRMSLFEEDSKILERIAMQYGEESKEYRAVKHGAIALSYVLTGQGHEWFKEYVEQFEGDLTPEQRKHLIEMGIDPDA
jgi:N-glycosylase/DNA lyase